MAARTADTSVGPSRRCFLSPLRIAGARPHAPRTPRRRRHAVKRRIALVAVLPLALSIGVAGAATGSGALTPASCTTAISTGARGGTRDPGSSPLTVDDLKTVQVSNARIIYAVAVGRSLPERAAVIAIATALQESKLYNLTNAVNADSLGLFQQRPSQGWGTAAQILDPMHASNAFYDHLIKVANWQSIPLTQAAQDVQRSAYPNAYAKWETLATALASQFSTEQPTTPTDTTGGTDTGAGCDDDGDGQPTTGDVSLPNGVTLPAGTPTAVATAIAWALAQRGTPYHYGGDCTNPHGGAPAHECDCSSLMQQAYHTAGVSIPRTTLDQVHAGAAVTSISAIAPGDLVFIPGSDGTRTVPRHVGMYIGDGLLVQAPHTGDVVKISTLSSWQSQISAIRRIVG